MQTWGKIKPHYFAPIWPERSFSHADLKLGKEETGCSSRVTDAHCSYWDLINFIEYVFPYLLYILRTISNTFKWFIFIFVIFTLMVILLRCKFTEVLFPVLTITYKAAKMLLYESFAWVKSYSLGKYLRVEWLGYSAGICLTFLKNCLPRCLQHFTFPSEGYNSFSYSTVSLINGMISHFNFQLSTKQYSLIVTLIWIS